MKVVFKLTLAQTLRAVARVTEIAKLEEYQKGWVDPMGLAQTQYQGNLRGWYDSTWNPNQVLEYHRSESGDYITYQGDRCPFVHNGHLYILMEIMGTEDPSDLTPVEYVTSDQRLRWYETMASYLETRGTVEEFRSEKNKGRGYYPPARWPEIRLAYDRQRAGTPDRILRAEFDSATLKALSAFK